MRFKKSCCLRSLVTEYYIRQNKALINGCLLRTSISFNLFVSEDRRIEIDKYKTNA